MDLQKARDWIDVVLKVMSIAAIIAAGAWAYYQFRLADTDASNIQMSVTTEVLKYSGDNRLLMIHVRPKNIGKVMVAPRHLAVTVRDLPVDLKPGAVDLDKLKERYKADILDRFMGGYEMEPGVEYDEVVTMIVPTGMYSVGAEMDLGDDYEVDHTTVARVE
jgi:hypothetical protein